jgi:hypothetical protein
MEAFFAALCALPVPPSPPAIDTDSTRIKSVCAVKSGDKKSME